MNVYDPRARSEHFRRDARLNASFVRAGKVPIGQLTCS